MGQANTTYRNPNYMLTDRAYHVRLECKNNVLSELITMANGLDSFAQVEQREKYNLIGPPHMMSFVVDFMFGERRDCEWFLLKYPTAQITEYKV